MAAADTIFALSSGSPPAGIAVIRISGSAAAAVLQVLGGRVPRARHASLMRLTDPSDGTMLDDALVLFMPGPNSATGEDCAELHLHGGRALVARVQSVLSGLPEMRRAEPGEFTLRAFRNGRMDLAEAEGLGDLLSAETELQLRNAQALTAGALSSAVGDWREAVLGLSARVETALDFSDEDDGEGVELDLGPQCGALAERISGWLDAPRAEKLREGYRVAIGGPPNAGKSSLFNALIEEEAAIATPIAGTTRDVLQRSVGLGGIPFVFVDTAGLRDATDDQIEAIGIERASHEIARADLVLWLGPEGEGPEGAWEIETMIDRPEHQLKEAPRHRLSASTGEGVTELRSALIQKAGAAMPKPGQVAVSQRQADLLDDAAQALRAATGQPDLLILAESLRQARLSFDRLLGKTGTEDMLDALFGRFCIGK